MKKVGFMGGTFSPPHYGHLLLAENARVSLGLDEVWFMPAADPPHKADQQVIPYEHRRAMAASAISGNDSFIISDFETERREKSYSAETLRLLHERYPDTEFYFIMGADSIFQIETWYHPELVMQRCIIVVAARDGMGLEALLKQKAYLKDKYNADIRLIDLPEVNISSSNMRKRIAAHKTIRYMTPDCVIDYIEAHRLYR